MAGNALIAIGSYFDWDIDAMAKDYDVCALARPDEIAVLSDDLRTSARALAYKAHDRLTAAHMDMLPGLGVIANYGVGYDSIDVAAATKRGIKVTNTPDVLNDDVADLAVAMLLAQSRQMLPASEWLRSGNWAAHGAFPHSRKVSGGRAGIVGLGRIGREIADRLSGFKMDIHYHSRSKKQTPGWTYHADPVALAAAVDYLFVALVGGPDTEGYVTRDVIAALGADGIIINVSRGSTIDEAALLEALETGAIGGAGLDVFLDEPTIDPRFLKLDNVVLQPHLGSATIEMRKAMGRLQRENIAAFFSGNALITPVN